MRVKFVYEGHQVKVIGADKVLIAYLKGTVLSVSDNSESVNIKINKKIHILGVCPQCRWIN